MKAYKEATGNPNAIGVRWSRVPILYYAPKIKLCATTPKDEVCFGPRSRLAGTKKSASLRCQIRLIILIYPAALLRGAPPTLDYCLIIANAHENRFIESLDISLMEWDMFL